jgi:ubiquitin-protein ligase
MYGRFSAHLYFPKEYPLRPPRMKFVTEIWHPNIDANGDGMLQKDIA